MQFSFAQEKTVTGVVSDELGPVAGANVVNQSTKAGTITDFDGNYSISAKQGDVLVVVDLEAVQEAGKSLVSPIAFTGNNKVEVFKIEQNVVAGEKGLLNYK